MGVYVTGEVIRDLLILKPKSVSDARISRVRRLPPVSPSAPYASPNGRAS